MKNQSVETKPRHKYSASQNFYNFKNNDFLKTNLILHQTIQVKTSPDDVLFDEDTYLKLIKNNQGISGALNSRKFTSKNLPSKSERNSSTPVLLPLDLKSVKTSLPVTDFTLDPLKPSGRDMKGSSLHFTPSKPLNSSQAMSVLLSPAQTNSARISTARTDSFPMISPRGYQSKKSLFGMTPEEVQSLEKQILAKTKLDRDRSETMSRVNTRNENKRDVSYFSERNARPYLPSQVNSPGVGSMQFINNGGQNDSQTATIRTTPEPVLTASVGQGENIEKAARLTHGSSFKKNTDFTSIEEEGPESKEIEGNGSVSRRMITVSVGAKKNSIDYSVQQNALGLHKGHIASLSGLPTTSLNDYLFKAHNLPLSPVNRSVKPMTAGTIDSKVMPRMFDSPRRKIKFDVIDFKKNDSDDLLNEIRREIPNILTGAPPSRQDVLVLSNWMNSKIKQIADDPKLKEDEKSIKYDKLYNICINEVFRQVSLECAERGDLLYRIWSCYFQIFTQCKMNLDGEIQRLKLEHQKENQKQYEWHQKFIEKKDQELEDCKLEIQKLLKSQEEDQNKIAKLLHRNTKYKQKIDQLKGVLAVTKAQVEEIKDENWRYAKRLAYKIANSTKGTYVPTFLASHGPKDNNAREASVPENLGVGSSLASPMKLTLPLTPDTVKVEGNIRGFRTEENEQSDSSGSDESSLDFVYEDTATNAKHVFKIDHLNNNVLINKKINSDENEQEAAAMLRGQALGVRTIQTCTKETQTNLVLAETKYDGVLDNQKVVDELVTELKVKRDIDVMAELDDIPSLDLSRIYDNLDLKDSKVLKRTFSWQTLAARTMVEDRMDGLAKHSGTPRSEFIRSLKKKLFPGSSENATPKSGVFNGNSDFHKLTKMLDGEAPNSSHKKMGGEYQFKIIEEEKTLSGEIKYKGTSTSPVTKNTNYLFVCEPIQEQLETNEDGKSFVKSLSGINRDSDDQQNKDVSIEVDEKQEALQGLEELEGQETEEVVLQENPQANKTEFVSVGSPVPKKKEPAFYESVQNTPKAENMSIMSDDLFHNLNEVAAEFGDVEKASKYGSIVEPRDSHNNSLDENLQGDGVIKKKQTKKFGSFDDEQEPRRAFSLSTLVNTKTHAMHLVSMMQTKKEDLAILDKAKLLTVMRMYKVEKEKNKVLQSSVVELEEQIMNEKEHQGKMKDNMDEMKVHIKMLEQLKAKCPHGKCSLCKKEEDAEFEEGEGEGEGSSRQNLDLSSSDNKTGVREAEGEVDEVEEEDENEGDDNDNDEAGVDLDALGDGDDEEYNDAGNMTPGGHSGETPIHRMSRQMTVKGLKKKKVTTGQQPEFHKKKVVNQNQLVSAALAIIMKVKEKKLTKFRNFMPIKSVLKTIHVLYGDRINQAKDNSSVKDDEFFVFAYKWFMNNFGFRKIAEQKYIIFLLSVKKYLHVVRINLFARFMSLLQGSSNFNADEFSKYLEGVEIINNSTLGIPIVSSETDSKIYVPFLRGLEYLRYFSENKLATDEYIEFKREFEALKVADPKNINRNGIVDIDLFMTKVLTKYRIICNRTKQFVVNAFKAADLDANKYCSLKEFLLIYRNIDPDRFDQGFAENLFNEHADIKIQGEINLSFDKFTVVCVEYGLFSDLQQDQFLGIQNQQEMEELMQKTRSQWSIHYAETTRKLNGSGSITEGEKAYWFSILKILNERITDFEKLEPNDVKPLLIAFKILDQEVEKLRENEAVRDVYGVKIRKSEIKETVEGMM